MAETATRETTETARCEDGIVQWTTRTRRDQVYDMLREAGNEGVTLADIAEHVPLPGPHIESLRMEGHDIEDESGIGIGPGGRWGRRLTLTKDAWA